MLLPLELLHLTPCQAYLAGKHGSPIQFFFILYSSLIAMIALTSKQEKKRKKGKLMLDLTQKESQYLTPSNDQEKKTLADLSMRKNKITS